MVEIMAMECFVEYYHGKKYKKFKKIPPSSLGRPVKKYKKLT